MLSKLCAEDLQNWYKHGDKVQQCINNTPPRSTKYSPFRILTGCEMRTDEGKDIRNMIEEFVIEELQETKTSNRKRFRAPLYKENELEAIKRTQFGPGLKLRSKYLGPYKVIRIIGNDRYEVEKVGEGEGPKITNIVAEYMKKWNPSSESNDSAGGPNVGPGARRTRSGQPY